MRAFPRTILAITGLLVAGCSASKSDTGACVEILLACHAVDTGSGVPHECHELAHGAKDALCGPRRAECLATCAAVDLAVPADANVGDAGGSDAGTVSDGGADCPSYCACMTTTCAATVGYPFGDGGTCAARCATMSTDEVGCWSKWCEQAKATKLRTHLCEHAWGMFNLDECDTL